MTLAFDIKENCGQRKATGDGGQIRKQRRNKRIGTGIYRDAYGIRRREGRAATRSASARGFAVRERWQTFARSGTAHDAELLVAALWS